MITAKAKKEYYQAMIAKNTEYKGVFYVVPVRKPHFSQRDLFYFFPATLDFISEQIKNKIFDLI